MEVAGLLTGHSLFTDIQIHGYVTSSAAPAGCSGRSSVQRVNPNVGANILSPAARKIEKIQTHKVGSGDDRTGASYGGSGEWRNMRTSRDSLQPGQQKHLKALKNRSPGT